MDEHNEDYHLVKEEIRNETDENGNTKIIIMKYFEKKNKYAENIKKANKAYHERNKETINKKIVEWQKLKYQNLETFLLKSLLLFINSWKVP